MKKNSLIEWIPTILVYGTLPVGFSLFLGGPEEYELIHWIKIIYVFLFNPLVLIWLMGLFSLLKKK